MPAVRMLTSLATQRHSFDEGQEVQATPDEAREWLAAGIAEVVREDRAETPEHPTPGLETAATHRTRRRNR